jgi:hypothetical protein
LIPRMEYGVERQKIKSPKRPKWKEKRKNGYARATYSFQPEWPLSGNVTIGLYTMCAYIGGHPEGEGEAESEG